MPRPPAELVRLLESYTDETFGGLRQAAQDIATHERLERLEQHSTARLERIREHLGVEARKAVDELQAILLGIHAVRYELDRRRLTLVVS
jgi:hypothetical protein